MFGAGATAAFMCVMHSDGAFNEANAESTVYCNRAGRDNSTTVALEIADSIFISRCEVLKSPRTLFPIFVLSFGTDEDVFIPIRLHYERTGPFFHISRASVNVCSAK